MKTLAASFYSSTLARCGIALLAAALALLIGRVLNPFAGSSAAYLTALAAVAFSSWYCGLGPSIICVAISLLGVELWFGRSTHALAAPPTPDMPATLVFLAVAGMIVAIGEVDRRQGKRLSDAAGELEEKVRQRTSDLDRSNQNLRELTAQLLNLQDEERRRIARELHDNAGQALSALAINLGVVTNDLGRLMNTVRTVSDSASLVKQMSDDIRTMSYLLHPPLLDEMGLVPALRSYIEGFAERSKIAVDFECPEEFGRVPPEVETAVFRVVQECLTNVLRHSGSPTAAVQMALTDGQLAVEVRDMGKGILPQMREQMESGVSLGVGIRGMRERIRQLGGSLEILSDGAGSGTRIIMRLPASEAARGQAVGSGAE